MIRALVTFVSTAALFACAASAFAQPPYSPAVERHRLQQQQLQDTLSLRLQQDMARSQPGLTLRDRQRLDELALRQRIEQQQLDNQQLHQQRIPHDPARSHVLRDIHSQERALQLQRFRDEQQQLLQSARPAPLQAAPRPGELELP